MLQTFAWEDELAVESVDAVSLDVDLGQAEANPDGEAGNSGDGGEAGNSGDGGEAGNSGDGGEAGNSGDGGEAGNSGDGGEAENSGDGGEAGNSGDAANEDASANSGGHGTTNIRRRAMQIAYNIVCISFNQISK